MFEFEGKLSLSCLLRALCRQTDIRNKRGDHAIDQRLYLNQETGPNIRDEWNQTE